MKSRLLTVFLSLCIFFSLTVPASAAIGDYLTRERMCVLLAEKLQLDTVNIPAESPFTDVNVTDENYAAIMACYQAGIISGTAPSIFDPRNNITRAQAAIVLSRSGLGAAPGSTYTGTVPPDISETSWYYTSVCGVLTSGAMSVRGDGNFYPNTNAAEGDINWSVQPEYWVVDKGSETLRYDLALGSIRIYANDYGVIRYEQGGEVVTSTGAVIVQQINNGTATTNTITIESGNAAITITGLNVDSATSPIAIETGAALALTLVGTSTLTCNATSYGPKTAGISVPGNAILSIGGSGTVTVTGGFSGAGIGGSYGEGGTITINGGTVTANGGRYGSGVGGASSGEGGTIRINGATVTATGGEYSAGIGGGGIQGGSGSGGEGGTITINNGTVIAVGGNYGTGIGGGGGCAGASGGAGGSITINGGAVIAIGDYSASGIGGGGTSYYLASGGGGGMVSISNAEVTATGDYHAIGGGGLDNAYGCDSITVTNSTIHLTHNVYSGSDYQEKIVVNTLPFDSAALVGNNAEFSVNAYGHSGLSYQWQTSADGTTWADVNGQTAATGLIPFTTENNGNSVRCKLTNGWGNIIYTDTATLCQLAFSQQPTDVSDEVGGTLSLNVASTCSNVTYQWKRSIDEGTSWADVPGEVYNTLILSGTLSDSGLYRCVIMAANGDSLASDAATVTINDPNAPVTYKTVYYQQDADGKTYTAFEQVVSSSTTGASVAAQARSYAYYTENTALGATSGTVNADGSLVLSRYYNRNSYTITIEMNGGSAEAAVTAIHGAAVSAPVNPTRLGYTFEGWYSDAVLTMNYNFTTMPTGNVTVYAKWLLVGAGRGIEYEIVGIALRDSSYSKISAIPRGTFYAEVSVKNLSSSTMDTLILATYDTNGKMLGMQFLFANPPVGYTFTLGASIDNSNGNVTKIKAFMLPMLGGLVPLANFCEYMT